MFRLRYLLLKARERLWIKPLVMCIFSIFGALLARAADLADLDKLVPEITTESLETLLRINSASMLAIATFSVASMVSAYASASTTGTPRAFSLIVSDDVSQNALSAFIGSFIFSIVSLIAIQNSYYGKSGRFLLFLLTLIVFSLVIFMFVRWVDRIARLGRLKSTIYKVELATQKAIAARIQSPHLGGVPANLEVQNGIAIYSEKIGYVQNIHMEFLQSLAKDADATIDLVALPGTFVVPGRALAYVNGRNAQACKRVHQHVADAFIIDRDRTFKDDPRFGLIVLSEIASRALSPGINDHGTAIDVVHAFVRLFSLWGSTTPITNTPKFDRVTTPLLDTEDLFEDSFGTLMRDGAGSVQVNVRLQKALHALTHVVHDPMTHAAKHYSRLALERAEQCLAFEHDRILVREAAQFSAHQ